MTVPKRWPLHPSPSEGEALSSWLTRIAASHRIGLTELLRDNLGAYSFDMSNRAGSGIDVDPPRELLAAIERRTGRNRDQLWGATIAGNVPWLLDSLDPPDDQIAFTNYARQHHALLPARERPARLQAPWRAWLLNRPLRRACPACADGPNPVAGITLVWQLPLTLSCPRHDCYLETVHGFVDTEVIWIAGAATPRPAPPAVLAMDQRTHDALRTGVVTLPRRDVHAGVWFRLLRTIIDELSTAATPARAHSRTLAKIWASIDQPSRGGLNVWRPFETLDWVMQHRLLEAAAAAMAMLEDGSIRPAGLDGAFFLAEPHPAVDDGHSPRSVERLVRAKTEPFDYWKAAIDSFNEAIALARTDPASAEMLYRFVASGPVGADEARRLLADVGVTRYPSSLNREPDRSRALE